MIVPGTRHWTERIDIVQGAVITTGTDKGAVNWTTPTTIEEDAPCSFQPASTETQEQAGLVAKIGRYIVVCGPLSVAPRTHRVIRGSAQYEILDYRGGVGEQHTELLVEAVA